MKNHLLNYKNEVLTQLCVLCGANVPTKKVDKVLSLVKTISFYNSLPRTINLLAIDLGIKNFSYCKMNHYNINEKPKIGLDHWNTLNLMDKYALDDVTSQSLGQLSYQLMHELCVDNPDIILIENQRTRSNHNSSTLPNVLNNFKLENMLYSTYYTFKHINALNGEIITMNSNKMMNFVLNRFLSPQNKFNNKNLRIKLLMHWINHKNGPVDFDLPNDLTSKTLIHHYNSSNPYPIHKLDDLFDSLLYCLNFILIYKNNLSLLHCLNQGSDVLELIFHINRQYFDTLSEFIHSQDLILHESFLDHV